MEVTYSEVAKMNSSDFPRFVDTAPDGSQYFAPGSALVKGWEKPQKKKRPQGSNQIRKNKQKTNRKKDKEMQDEEEGEQEARRRRTYK